MKSSKNSKKDTKILGFVTINDKGQVVIPSEVRESIDLKSGDKLVVMTGHGHDSIVLIKADRLEQFANHMLEQISNVRIKNN